MCGWTLPGKIKYWVTHHRKQKEIVFDHYGRKCCWPNCKVTDLDMLSLDHVLDNGYEHIKEIGKHLYGYLIKHNFPDNVHLQTMCMNHQFKKRQMKYRGEKLPKKVTTI
jgi:hypothetical protein